MFYSKGLLSKKGALGNVWIAAHGLKKLKREQVKKFNVSSCVDMIIRGEADKFAHRILAFLLLGVARIYSKKVEFLLHDCDDMLDKLRRFTVDERVNKSISRTHRSYRSITLPDRFELDAFDLDISEDQDMSRIDVRSLEDLTLTDASRMEVHYENDEEHHGREDSLSREAFPSAHTPVRDVSSPLFMEIDSDTSPYDTSSLKPGMEEPSGTDFSLEKRPEPNIERQSVERLVEFELPLATRLQDIVLGEVDTAVPQSNSLRNYLSVSVDVTPESRIAGDGSTEFVAVRGPATGESAKVMKRRKCLLDEEVFAPNRCTSSPKVATGESAMARKKRKCLFDEKIVLSNRVLKHCLDDKSNSATRRKGRRQTALDAPRACKMPTLPKSLFERLIPCVVDFGSLVSRTKIAGVSVETAATTTDSFIAQSPVTQMSAKPAEICENPVVVKPLDVQISVEAATSDMQMSYEQNSIAPVTPVNQSASLRLLDVPRVCEPDMLRSASPFDSLDKRPNFNKDLVLDIALMDEEVNSGAGYNPEKFQWTARTRKVASYLHQNISTQQNGDGRLNLSRLLENKTRTDSARMFYEILALKCGNYINVKQEDAYGDIIVGETRKLKQTLDANDDRSRR
ncbi:hypothetical protein M9H77_37123 [Catharanthus roseus]|uniref:Uncharacterized protein n=1 Tax=Catharanthus roseus TaxID=4058 RepID=A0ACB9ZUJ7_CATRO|nr:hypothetical protein M9H77_37123 [Catharanthus roseus]